MNDNETDFSETWYEDAREQFINDTAAYCGLTDEAVRAVYARCVAEGLIDYDIEKDVFYEQFVTDGEEPVQAELSLVADNT